MIEVVSLQDHCQNKTCFNFSSKHDLSGTWCQDECFIESESGQKITHIELLEMKVDYDWDLDDFEKIEIEKLGITKSRVRIEND